jgi:hypothetical protein
MQNLGPAQFGTVGAAINTGTAYVSRDLPDGTCQLVSVTQGMAIYYGDFVTTDQGDRIRINGFDGSILSLGSNTQLNVLPHDARSEQSWLEFQYGQFRQWVQDLLRDPNQAPTNTQAPGDIIGALFDDNTDSIFQMPNDTSASITTEGDWVALDSSDLWQYDSYDNVYYDFGGGAGTGGGDDCGDDPEICGMDY